MRLFPISLFLTMALLAAAPTAAQPLKPENGTSQPATASSPAEQAALDFLRTMEERYRELKTLHATFLQVREDAIFGDSYEAEGEFWYTAPDRFRANYEAEHGEQIWMLGDELISFVPTQKQVDMVRLAKGKDAPIHRLLLGFGMDTAKILDIFEVRKLEDRREGLLGIEFKSRDLSRSMEYGNITIWFDEAKAQPRIIVAEDNSSVFTVKLEEVEPGAQIDEAVFTLPEWPEDVEVFRRGSL